MVRPGQGQAESAPEQYISQHDAGEWGQRDDTHERRGSNPKAKETLPHMLSAVAEDDCDRDEHTARRHDELSWDESSNSSFCSSSSDSLDLQNHSNNKVTENLSGWGGLSHFPEEPSSADDTPMMTLVDIDDNDPGASIVPTSQICIKSFNSQIHKPLPVSPHKKMSAQHDASAPSGDSKMTLHQIGFSTIESPVSPAPADNATCTLTGILKHGKTWQKNLSSPKFTQKTLLGEEKKTDPDDSDAKSCSSEPCRGSDDERNADPLFDNDRIEEDKTIKEHRRTVSFPAEIMQEAHPYHHANHHIPSHRQTLEIPSCSSWSPSRANRTNVLSPPPPEPYDPAFMPIIDTNRARKHPSRSHLRSMPAITPRTAMFLSMEVPPLPPPTIRQTTKSSAFVPTLYDARNCRERRREQEENRTLNSSRHSTSSEQRLRDGKATGSSTKLGSAQSSRSRRGQEHAKGRHRRRKKKNGGSNSKSKSRTAFLNQHTNQRHGVSGESPYMLNDDASRDGVSPSNSPRRQINFDKPQPHLMCGSSTGSLEDEDCGDIAERSFLFDDGSIDRSDSVAYGSVSDDGMGLSRNTSGSASGNASSISTMRDISDVSEEDGVRNHHFSFTKYLPKGTKMNKTKVLQRTIKKAAKPLKKIIVNPHAALLTTWHHDDKGKDSVSTPTTLDTQESVTTFSSKLSLVEV